MKKVSGKGALAKVRGAAKPSKDAESGEVSGPANEVSAFQARASRDSQ